MFIDPAELHNDGYTIVNARTLAAAATFTSTDLSRPILGGVLVETDKDGTSCTACDSYKLGHFKSLPLKTKYTENPEGKVIVNWQQLKKTKLVATKPKTNQWVAIKANEDKHTVSIKTIEQNRNNIFELVGEATLNLIEGNFPMWKKLDGRKKEMDAEKQSNVGPGLNTSYLITVFRAMELAVSADGNCITQFIHGTSTNEPIHFQAKNVSGEEGFALLMPVRL